MQVNSLTRKQIRHAAGYEARNSETLRVSPNLLPFSRVAWRVLKIRR